MKKLFYFLLLAICLTGVPVNAQTWENVGSAGFSSGTANFTTIAIDGSGTPYVAFRDVSNSNKATVMKYNSSSTSWENVGSAGFSSGSANFPYIAINSIGTPYVAFGDGANSNKATVMAFNGTSWEVVGSAGFSAGQADMTTLAFDGSDYPYVAYQDFSTSQKATVKRFDGSTWVTVGSVGFSDNEAYFTTIAISSNGTPYIAFDYAGSYGDGRAHVMKYNSSTSSWESLGTGNVSDGGAHFTDMALDGDGTPYVVYLDYTTTTNKVSVKKYNSSTSSWETVGTLGFSASMVEYTTIAVDGSGTPYVVYKDWGSYPYKATVKKFEGSSWVTVGTVRFTADQATFTSIAINSSGTPYVAYVDWGNSKKATVMSFNTCTNPSYAGTIGSDQTICSGFSPSALTSTASASGNTGTLQYKWQSSVTSSSASFSDISGATSSTYTSGSLTATTWFRRLARVDCSADWSGAVSTDAIQITVNATPTLAATSYSDIGSESVIAYGNVTANGGSTITARGFCYGASANPTTAGPKITETGSFSTGTFSGTITGLSKYTTYHVRSYAINSCGTNYGDDISFSTIPTLPTWGLIALCSITLLFGGFYIRKMFV